MNTGGRMRLRIHRGTKEIGGTCIEVEAQGRRLVLDVGLPLGAPDDEGAKTNLLPAVPGFRSRDDSLLGVMITHPHPDHYGLAGQVRSDVPIYIGEAAHRMLNAASPYVRGSQTLAASRFIEDRRPIDVGPFRVTPYLVDHSAFDAYALLVEADGKRVFYSGDFRGHGRKRRLFDAVTASPPKDIDVLLMEGTTIGRTGADVQLVRCEAVRPVWPARSDQETAVVRRPGPPQGQPRVPGRIAASGLVGRHAVPPDDDEGPWRPGSPEGSRPHLFDVEGVSRAGLLAPGYRVAQGP